MWVGISLKLTSTFWFNTLRKFRIAWYALSYYLATLRSFVILCTEACISPDICSLKRNCNQIWYGAFSSKRFCTLEKASFRAWSLLRVGLLERYAELSPESPFIGNDYTMQLSKVNWQSAEVNLGVCCCCCSLIESNGWEYWDGITSSYWDLKNPVIQYHGYFYLALSLQILLLDGKAQSAEADEFVYHELLVHPAMLLHPHPKSVFVAGGSFRFMSI